MQRITYLNKYGDQCQTVGILDHQFIVQVDGNGWGIPFSRILKQEEVAK